MTASLDGPAGHIRNSSKQSVEVLVTGGAGYIGSHTVEALISAGYRVTVYDDLSRGHREHIPGVPLVTGRLEDEKTLEDLFASNRFDAVVHFAGESLVGESIRDPEKYFLRNVGGGLRLLSAMIKAGVRKMVFSSSAGVYGEPERVPLTEDAPLFPVSPYGESKAFLEKVLGWYSRAYGLRSISLRYFNAAGASFHGRIGEDHDPETHLIPLVIQAAVCRKPITVFGSDYPTPDGTPVRDYVHVVDLARGHILALEALDAGAETTGLNLGTGVGFSVMEIIKAVNEIAGAEVPYVIGPRREGDPAVLVASYDRAKEVLGWEPLCSSLEEIVESAWKWHTRKRA